MFGFNTGIEGGLSGCITSVLDRIVSFFETIIDTVKAKVAAIYETNRPVAIALGAILVLVVIAVAVLTVMFLPGLIALFKAVGNAILTVITRVIKILGSIVSKILSKIGGVFA